MPLVALKPYFNSALPRFFCNFSYAYCIYPRHLSEVTSKLIFALFLTAEEIFFAQLWTFITWLLVNIFLCGLLR